MMRNILGKIRIFTISICFLTFLGLNYVFSTLYCGEVLVTSWCFSVFWALLFCGILTLLPTVAKRIGIVFLTIWKMRVEIIELLFFRRKKLEEFRTNDRKKC